MGRDLGEFAIAYEEGKLVGVLTGTGGITEALAAVTAALMTIAVPASRMRTVSCDEARNPRRALSDAAMVGWLMERLT